MSTRVPRGRYHLRGGIRLISGERGCLVLQSAPLRAIRVNPAAMGVLKRSRTGFSPYEVESDSHRTAARALCDTLYEAGVLDWEPPEEIFEPFVSIIVPVYNRTNEIGACLASLLKLNYPASRREIIVVDDASRDQTVSVIENYDVRVIVQPKNMGQSAARNIGVQAAKGEIIAFMDSDCTADPDWLRELLPYFHDPRLVLVGGSVDAPKGNSQLDRYEAVQSPLNMGAKSVTGKGKDSVFYVPTCNMVLRKETYIRAGGLDERLRVGEDVDFCWKLMALGYRLMYTPEGRVTHRHRNRLFENFRRRFDYGTSEAVLYDRYRQIIKRFPWHWEGFLLLILWVTCLTLRSVPLLVAGLIYLMVEPFYKRMRFNRHFGLTVPLHNFFSATGKSHLTLACQFGLHLTRYYLMPAMAIAIFVPQMALPLLVLTIMPAVVLFFQKKPNLWFPVFLFFFWLDQLFYQSGVFWGCLKQRSFRLYRVSFAPAGRSPSKVTGRASSMEPRKAAF
ncbi:MAG: mycofactocin biosynthesis glycosyltransferase MftF [Deltaproteobacteria bacterium]|nr:mycofactocin biosynthesis glycosyltransferase MftF [Deltaproteobacteria bacterium]